MIIDLVFFAGTDRDVGEVLVKSLQNTKYSVDEKLNSSIINIFSQKSNKPEEISNGDDEDQMKHDRSLEPINEYETDSSDDESDDGDLDESEEAEAGSPKVKVNNIREELELDKGRKRRKAVFRDEDEDDQEVMHY